MASSTEVLHDLTVDSVIRGYHVYKDIWVPTIGEILFCEQEPGNKEDRFAVAILSHGNIVGHVPRTILRIYWYFIQHQESILCEVTGNRQYSRDLRQGGLDIPCMYHFTHTRQTIVNKLHRELSLHAT